MEECECGAFMERMGEVRDSDHTGEYWDIVTVFYQCLRCKTIRMIEGK